MNIAHEVTPTQIAFHKAAQERARKRLMAARMVAANANETALLAAPEVKETAKAARLEVDENHHVLEWRKWVIREKTAPIRTYITARAKEFGLTYDEVVSGSRKRRVILPKHRIMWEIKRKVRPEMSYPEIAKFFGLCDHTSAIYAVTKMDKIMGWAGDEG